MEHKIIAVANQKGGVGKTTTCVNLGIGLARQGRKVLLVDFDPQANLTISLGYQMPDELPVTLTDAVYNLLNRGTSRGKDEPLLDIRTAILHHEEGVDLLPSSLGLFSLELTMTGANARETILKRLLAPLKSQYDVILIDCAPTLGMFTLNSLSAADSILIPVSVNFLSIEGISQLLDTVMFIKQEINPDVIIVLTMLDARTSYARGMVSLISNTYGNSFPIFNAQIPYSVRASKISALGCSIYERDFTIITNAALRDTNLSLKAKGLLALMLSEHDGWNFTIKGLSAKCKEGVDAVAAIVKELEAQGYVVRRRERSTANGKARAKKYHRFQNHRH